MTEIYLHFLFTHYGLYGNAPVQRQQAATLRPRLAPVIVTWRGAVGGLPAARPTAVAAPLSPCPAVHGRSCGASAGACTMRAELIGHFEPCMTEIYLHIDARMADYIRTHL